MPGVLSAYENMSSRSLSPGPGPHHASTSTSTDPEISDPDDSASQQRHLPELRSTRAIKVRRTQNYVTSNVNVFRSDILSEKWPFDTIRFNDQGSFRCGGWVKDKII